MCILKTDDCLKSSMCVRASQSHYGGVLFECTVFLHHITVVYCLNVLCLCITCSMTTLIKH